MFGRLFYGLPLKTNYHDQLVSTARSGDRAVLLWLLAIVSLSVLATLEENIVALYLVCLALVLFPATLGSLRRLGIFLLAILIPIVGTSFLIFALPIVLLAVGFSQSALAAAFAITSALLLAHHIQSIPEFHGQTLHASSLAFLLLPLLIALIVVGRQIKTHVSIILLVSAALVCIALDAGAGRWWGFEFLTSPLVRVFLVILPCAIAAVSKNFRLTAKLKQKTTVPFVAAAFGMIVTGMLPVSPINRVIFDEAHGRWETVKGTFSPDDFGREANYSYSLLARYTQRLTGSADHFESENQELPSFDSLFVLKMPTIPLTRDFSKKLSNWVKNGGRLLVVADHTDLYDTTQNLNDFLGPEFGLLINSDAVFNRTGLPTVSKIGFASAVVGRIDANNRPLPWQTGASIKRLSFNTQQLATFGPSFSEPGDYSAPNRFGPFNPRSSLRYFNHSAVLAQTHGFGAISILLDSTPWSNFSIFKQQYTHIFRGILHSLTNVYALRILELSSLALAVTALLFLFFSGKVIGIIGGAFFGITLGAAAQIGIVSLHSPINGRDFDVKVIAGSQANFEFLNQLVPPAQRNFSRIISSISKYNLIPAAFEPGAVSVSLKDSKKWLLITPDISQLPEHENLLDHLRRGDDFAVFFGPEQASDDRVKAWLNQLGIFVQTTTALGTIEDAIPGDFLNRRGLAILRDIRFVSRALPTSIIAERIVDPLVQTFTIRPATYPRKSGILSLSFSADQFSDDAIGDVWEGVNPTSIGRLREKQMAAAILGDDPPNPFPKNLWQPSQSDDHTALKKFLFMEDGIIVLTGEFENRSVAKYYFGTHSINEDPTKHLFLLRQLATAFVRASCPSESIVTRCENRLLGPEMKEWMVSWGRGPQGEVKTIELLHERRFSSNGRTLNVVFSE